MRRRNFDKKKEKNGAVSEENFLLNDQTSFAVREAYKSLRTNVMFSLTAGESGRIIGVTSTEKGEGKSTNSFNLALSMAETGKKILYLDCDLRLSVAAERADLKASPGLSNILVGLAKLDECIQQYKDTKLSVITAGDFPPNPAELLGSAQMEELCGTLRERYDYIIADLPPVGLVTDAAITSKFFDGVIFIVKEGYSHSDAIKSAVRSLEFVGARILGFVYTGSVEKRKGRYGKYGKYGKYGYRYGYEDYYGYGRSQDQKKDSPGSL